MPLFVVFSGKCLRRWWFAVACVAVAGLGVLRGSGTTLVFAAEPIVLFDGKSFEGWEGDIEKTWRIEDGAITAGSLETTVPRNEFLCTTRSFENFELTLKFKLEGTEGFVNGGVQIRSQRIPNHHEMKGYQADIGKGYFGALYDESRRNRVLAAPSPEVMRQVVREGWNDYKIRCEGKRIQLWLNGVQTVDYTEEDSSIPTDGVIGLQIHGNGKTVIRFKDIVLQPL